MKHSRRAIVASALLLTAGATAAVRAEVSVRTDRTGNFSRTQVIPSGPSWNPRIWTVKSRGVRFRALNPRGDLRGDLWPAVVESTRAPHHPWAVWSRNEGGRYNLAWSRWTRRGWTKVQVIEQRKDTADDLDPDLTFDAMGRAYVVWWRRDAAGHGTVYLSVFAGGGWQEPYMVSEAGRDSRYATIAVEEEGRVRVEYQVAEGTITHYLALADPDTITDDINPQGMILDLGSTFVSRKP